MTSAGSSARLARAIVAILCWIGSSTTLVNAMERTTQTLVTTDRVNVSVDLYQEGTHDAVIIICPGFFQSKDTTTFQHLSRALAKDDDVLPMDFRGHGRSSGLYTF